ncbi:MAG: TIGR04283 family arsenosugar biosynthesis glycosyltransferase [Proteobacteria bacterium]|nr:TIGR04283 family arsenosugar biosynthesis glycosyltransferase [Pseudomonadota bacterium]
MSDAHLSIIIPALNEASGVAESLQHLQILRRRGHEIILADGGSQDATVTLAQPWVDRVIHSSRGRALQMNAGAQAAHGQALVFLHADTQLPPDADRLILSALEKRQWGRFDVRLSGTHPLLRIVEWMMNWRSRLTGIATGDQAIFVRRDSFQHAGGFPVIPLMEDIALSRALKRLGPPLCLRARVVTSSRRWEQRGLMRTILLMWWLRLAYALGVDPSRIAKRYRP